MDLSIIEKYVDKVYGYAINRTYSREEADELSQEILFTAVRELPKIRDEKRNKKFSTVDGKATRALFLQHYYRSDLRR